MLIGLIINNIYVNFKEKSLVKAKFYLLLLKHVLSKYLNKTKLKPSTNTIELELN